MASPDSKEIAEEITLEVPGGHLARAVEDAIGTDIDTTTVRRGHHEDEKEDSAALPEDGGPTKAIPEARGSKAIGFSDDIDFNWDDMDEELEMVQLQRRRSEDDMEDEVDDELEEDDSCFPLWNRLSTMGRWLFLDLVALLIFIPFYTIAKYGSNDNVIIASVALSAWASFIMVTIVCLNAIRLTIWGLIELWKRTSSRLRQVQRTQLIESLQKWLTMALWTILNYGLWIWILRTQVCPDTHDCFSNPVSSFFIGIMVSSIAFLIKRYLFQSFVRSFHKEAYERRVNKLRFAEFVLDTLREARKKHEKSRTTVARLPTFTLSSLTRSRDSESDDGISPFTLAARAVQAEGVDLMEHTAHIGADKPPEVKGSASDAAHDGKTEASGRNLTAPGFLQQLGEAISLSKASIEHNYVLRGRTLQATTTSPNTTSKAPRGLHSQAHDPQSRRGDDLRKEATDLARKTFGWLCRKDRKEIELDDFLPHFSKFATARKAFNLFDRNASGGVSKREMRFIVIEIFEEQRDLNKSIEDMHKALTKLNLVLTIITVFLLFWVWLVIYGVDLASVFVTLTSLLVLSTYVVGGTLTKAFSCIVFLFVTHPYDVGDIIQIQGVEGSFIVEEMDILTTTFRQLDGMLLMVSNVVISDYFISNIRRSSPMTQFIHLEVPINTDVDLILELKRRMTEWVTQEKSDFVSFDLYITEMASEKYSMHVTISVKHRDNWQDVQKRNQRQTKVLTQLKHTLEDMGISSVEG
ncbi:hypothetical protein M427DRAFT_476970 [Gonapodya prolifera JEL478]|uniref:EF-hand domain-containing protein n=1 Tax=Gonapodya prolifera (strain JEL478) TaxID=1344416 RepID=A0A139A121_GONPJ|nr:hypothetical protein M427DRAFT_476970 [Gonapodya prolifera JEL478]|eukprot:KXS10469.1 hypothetical protein M427DRAFT_476970 [Gonapodya prolifera JEL478]